MAPPPMVVAMVLYDNITTAKQVASQNVLEKNAFNDCE